MSSSSSSIQISHACAILFSTLLFPLCLIMFNIVLYGEISGAGLGYVFVMFIVGPVYFVIGPIIGVLVHLFGIHDVYKKLAFYSAVGIVLGLILYFFFNNSVTIVQFMLIGLFMIIIYFTIQHTIEKMLRKLKLP